MGQDVEIDRRSHVEGTRRKLPNQVAPVVGPSCVVAPVPVVSPAVPVPAVVAEVLGSLPQATSTRAGIKVKAMRIATRYTVAAASGRSRHGGGAGVSCGE